jgi:hypothetical protein
MNGELLRTAVDGLAEVRNMGHSPLDIPFTSYEDSRMPGCPFRVYEALFASETIRSYDVN